MPDASPTVDIDFSAQMQALVIEAEQAREKDTPKTPERRASTEPVSTAPAISLAQMLRPLFLGMESLMRSQTAQSTTLERLEKALGSHASIPEVLSDAKVSLDQRNVVNRAMFDALHAELKGYKNDFLLESVMRPVVRDLISVYDAATEIHRQAAENTTAAPGEKGNGDVFATVVNNLEHHVHYVLEVLERMEVRLVPPIPGKLDKRNQKVVAREPASCEEEDLVVARSVRPAFTWRERLFRPEEVIIKKWGLAAAAAGDGDAANAGPA